jgi:Large eukaryotic DNA virus major capsid protein
LNIPFTEPLKYLTSTTDADLITVSLPLEAVNGPVREIIWFLRRKAAYQFNSWTNYGAYLENEIDPVYKPQRPLLTRAVLRVGAVVWADEEELWWRARGSLAHAGGVQVYNSYVYAYNFADKPALFGPSGSMNATRAEMRLDLTVAQPTGVDDKEWEVQVFVLTHNWMRFQNGMAEVLFRD